MTVCTASHAVAEDAELLGERHEAEARAEAWHAGRYSHSLGDVLDLRDLDRLGRLVVAVATTLDW